MNRDILAVIQENMDSYEIKITDEAGREYFESLASDRKSGRYTRVSGTRYSFDGSEYNTYTSVDGVLEPVIYPATGQPVYASEAVTLYANALDQSPYTSLPSSPILTARTERL